MEPLRTPSDLERALSEALGLLETLDDAGPAGERRLEALLTRIEEYRDAQIPQAEAPPTALTDFEGRLRAYGRRWPGDLNEGPTEPWSPMLGGDVRPPDSRSD